MSLGSAVAAAVEVFLVRVNPIEVLLEGIDERLEAVQELLQAYAGPDSNPAQSEAAKRVVSLAIVGTGRLRRQQRSAENGHATLRQYLSELNSVVALAGRLIDISANMTVISPHPHHAHAEWLRELAEEINRIRLSIRNKERPGPMTLATPESSDHFPLLPELQRTLVLVPRAFSPAGIKQAAIISVIDEQPKTRWLVADAFSNPGYVKFAMKGSLAAMTCYILYTALDWPGISTSVITCLVTALSTVGASKQKQFLRIAGASFGGLLAIFSLVFLLPHMDRITPMALLVTAVSAFGAWVATSSPRLSYFGLQTCLAFYITTLQDFAAPTVLAPARDRFIGVLLGLTVMWVVNQNLWPTYDLDAMRKALGQNLTLFGELVTVFDEVQGERAQAIPRIWRLRELINTGFQSVQAHGGTVLFDFGPDRQRKLALRNHVLQVQASLRTAFLLELAILQYRIQLDPRTIPEPVREAQIDFNRKVQGRLLALKDLPGELGRSSAHQLELAVRKLESEIRGWEENSPAGTVSPNALALITLSRQMGDVLNGIPQEHDTPALGQAEPSPA